MRYFVDIYPNMDVLRVDLAGMIYNGDLSEEQEGKFIKLLDNLIQQGFDEVEVYMEMLRNFNAYLDEIEQLAKLELEKGIA